jgi:hypothetical protein
MKIFNLKSKREFLPILWLANSCLQDESFLLNKKYASGGLLFSTGKKSTLRLRLGQDQKRL